MNTDDFSHSDDQLCRKKNLGYRRRRVVLVGRFVGAMFGAVDAAKERGSSGREEATTMELFSLSLSLSLESRDGKLARSGTGRRSLALCNTG
jgi:hypothetical protein